MEASHSFLCLCTIYKVYTPYTYYIHPLIFGFGSGPVEQPPLGPNGKSSGSAQVTSFKYNCVKVLCDFQWQADKICSKETPDWKALEATKALTSRALT